jgi:GTP cyclohydrolase I
MSNMNKNEKKIIENLSEFIDFLGIKKDANTADTPKRMLNAWQEMCMGLNSDKEVKELLSVVFPSKYTGMVSQGPINVHSLCSHHLLPVSYEIFIGYIPVKNVIGLGKISKAIALMAAKPQNQEDLTQDIADNFKKYLKPEGIGVFVKGRHSCMFCRNNGVNHQDALNITTAVRGSFRKNLATKEEFLKNINLIRQSK